MTSKVSRDRALGALMGVHVGDCLGATFEFQSWSTIRASHPTGLREIVGGGALRWQAGQPTDDTDLTRAVLLAYRDRHRRRPVPHPTTNPADDHNTNQIHDEEFDIATVAGVYMLDWFYGRWPYRNPGSAPVDIGLATRKGLERFRNTGGVVRDHAPSGDGEGSAGNGSLMRCIPSAVFDEPLDVALRNARRIGRITHADSSCVDAVAAYVSMAWTLVRGGSVEAALAAGMGLAEHVDVRRAMVDGVGLDLGALAREGPTPGTLQNKGRGWVVESLKLAVAALTDGRGVEDVLVDVVRVGRDTDTNAAVAGGLVGARDGVEGIPARWKDKCWFAREFGDVVDEILEGTT